jgi:hypothetical protein
VICGNLVASGSSNTPKSPAPARAMRTLAMSRSTRDRAKDGTAGSTVIDTGERSYAGLERQRLPRINSRFVTVPGGNPAPTPRR